MGWADIGYREGSGFVTPHLDKLAAEGVKLESFYVSPTCTPSRSQFMTGKYNYRIGMQDSVVHSTEPRGVPLTEEFLSDRLRAAGYSTAAVGKWHLGMHMPQYTPLQRGFDRHYGILTGGGDHTQHVSVSQSFTSRDERAESRTFSGVNIWEEGEVSPDNFVAKHSTDLYTDRAIKYVEELREVEGQKRPWFIYLAYQAVHDPIDTSPEWYESNECSILSASDAEKLQEDSPDGVDWNNRKVMCGMMAQVDAGMGRVRSYLESSGQWENTVIVLFSDNGGIHRHGSTNTPLAGEKGQYWEGGIRVPAFVSGGFMAAQLKMNRRQPGEEYLSMVHVTDLHATLLALAAGGTGDVSLDGLDHWSAWAGPRSPVGGPAPQVRKDMVINLNSHFFGNSGAVRIGDMKLMRNPDPREAVIYSKVKQRLQHGEAQLVEEELFRMTQSVLGEMGIVLGTNAAAQSYMFNVTSNMGERLDGSCSDPAACQNLYGHPDYAEEQARLEDFFDKQVTSMAPATFKWQDDGPLADPANFGGVWTPWRDERGEPLAMYYGMQGEPLQPEANFVVPTPATLASTLLVDQPAQLSASTVLAALVSGTAAAFLTYKAGRREGYRRAYLRLTE
jgi:arylsulfatase I/J